MHCIILDIALERFSIVAHSCAAYFDRNAFLLNSQHFLSQEPNRYTQNP